MIQQFGFIYITTNHVNGKRYIGQCSYQKPRWKTYLGSGIFLKKAIKKYGKENFSREIICDAFSREALSELELHFIKEYDAVDDQNFYNIADGGYSTRGFLGKTHSESYKEKMREFSAQRPVTDKMRENARNLCKNMIRTESHSKASRENALKMGLSNKGRIHSQEAKEKMSASRLGINNSRAKIWTLEDENGSTFILESLKQWCKERNLNNGMLANTLKSKRFYKGFRVNSSISPT
jgi:group I intron endonuclease